MRIIIRIAYKIRFLFCFWIVHKGEKDSYLRSIGVKIGNDCDIITKVSHFGSATEPWLVEIGNKVTLADGVWLITHDGSSRLFRNKFQEMSIFGNYFGPIKIMDNSFIGTNSIILPGVTIGPNSIVGAGSVVTKSIPSNTVAAGNPARVICSIEKHISKFRKKQLVIDSKSRKDLRNELSLKFWGEKR